MLNTRSDFLGNDMINASIVLYKHSYEDLKPTLDSLINSPEISKIILVDNDDSDWAKRPIDLKINYIKSEGNYGFGYGHNVAIKKFANECQYFLICNPDITFDSNIFSSFIKFIENRPEGLFLPKILYPNGNDQYGARLIPTPLDLFARRFSQTLANYLNKRYLLTKYNINKSCFVPNLSGCFMLFKSDCLLKLDGFDERYFMYLEDIDLSRRCAEKYGNLYCPEYQIIHNHEQGSYKNQFLLKTHIESAVAYFNKWGWFFDKQRVLLNQKTLKELKDD